MISNSIPLWNVVHHNLFVICWWAYIWSFIYGTWFLCFNLTICYKPSHYAILVHFVVVDVINQLNHDVCALTFKVVIDGSCQVSSSKFYCFTYGVVQLVVSFLLGSLFQNHGFHILMIKKGWKCECGWKENQQAC